MPYLLSEFQKNKNNFNDAIAVFDKEAIYMKKNATTLMQTNRNKDWVEKMPRMMEERSNLFGVGAAHLTDNNGIIHLLRQKGYTVTPVLIRNIIDEAI